MADPVVHITNGIPDSGTGNITTLGMVLSALPASLGAGGGLRIDGSGTALPISGTVAISGTPSISGTITANAGTNLNTSALALEGGGNLAQLVTALGAVTASPASNTIGDRLKAINNTLSSPMQNSGGSVTANAGTNLNTSALALESGGNLTTLVTTTGASTDAAVASGAAGSLSAKLRTISRDLVANIVLAAGTALLGKVGIDQTTPGTTNGVAVNSVLGVYQEATIATGGTAQNLFSGATPTNGFELINTHASEVLYFREANTAAIGGASSTPVQPGSAYMSPRGYKPTGAISVIAGTTGHGVIGKSY